MLVSDKDALERLSSPMNLMNRLKSASGSQRRNSMGLFGIGRDNTKPAVSTFQNPFHKSEETSLVIPSKDLPETPADSPESNEPSLDTLVNNADSQVQLALAHDEALKTLVNSVKLMNMKLDDIKPDKLPSVISATSKVVDQIQRQRIDANKERGNRSVHFHFYTPTQKRMEDYDVVEVG